MSFEISANRTHMSESSLWQGRWNISAPAPVRHCRRAAGEGDIHLPALRTCAPAPPTMSKVGCGDRSRPKSQGNSSAGSSSSVHQNSQGKSIGGRPIVSLTVTGGTKDLKSEDSTPTSFTRSRQPCWQLPRRGHITGLRCRHPFMGNSLPLPFP